MQYINQLERTFASNLNKNDIEIVINNWWKHEKKKKKKAQRTWNTAISENAHRATVDTLTIRNYYKLKSQNCQTKATQGG